MCRDHLSASIYQTYHAFGAKEIKLLLKIINIDTDMTFPLGFNMIEIHELPETEGFHCF